MSQPGLSVTEPFDREAFTTSLNCIFQPQGITAVSREREDCWQIALLGVQSHDPEETLTSIYHHLVLWRIPVKVMVIGRQIGQVTATWVQILDPESAPEGAESAIPQQRAVATDTLSLTPADHETQDFLIFLSSVGLVLGLAWSFWLAINRQPGVTAIAPESRTGDVSTSPVNRSNLLPRPAPPTPPGPAVTLQTQVRPSNAPQGAPGRQPVTEPVITIKAVGDMVTGTNFLSNSLPQQPVSLFQAVRPYLQGADILFGNFESTLTNYPNSAKDTNREQVFAFRSPPTHAEVLKQVGFDVLSVANNHSYDFQATGFRDTVRAIQRAGMLAVGQKRQIVYSQVKGVRIAFIGFSYLDLHNQIQDLRTGRALVQEARQQADIVVISMHAGAEGSDALRVGNQTELFYGEDRGNKVLFARAMIESGADLVLGHGPHVARAMELYQGRLIVYSLGNFVGYHTLSTRGILATSLVLEVQLNAQGQFVRGRILPIHLDSEGIPRPDPRGRSIQLIRELTQADFPATPLKIDARGQISPQLPQR